MVQPGAGLGEAGGGGALFALIVQMPYLTLAAFLTTAIFFCRQPPFALHGWAAAVLSNDNWNGIDMDSAGWVQVHSSWIPYCAWYRG